MGKCVDHPERETQYLCMKHQVYLCEECLKCKDPKIYCKYRSSCPIWFMSKNKEGWDIEDRQEAAPASCVMTFLPGGQTASVSRDSTLLAAVQAADVHLNASCSGKGSCGKSAIA